MGRVQEGKSPTLKQIRPHHRSMARALVAGLTPTEVARSFGFSAGQISRIIQTPMFQAELARLEAGASASAMDLRDDIRRMAQRAVEVLDADLEMEVGEDLRARALRQKAAMDVLDRAGVSRGDADDPACRLVSDALAACGQWERVLAEWQEPILARRPPTG